MSEKNEREDHRLAGEVSVEEAREALGRFVRSHFRRDDDIRLGAFISRAEVAFSALDEARTRLATAEAMLASVMGPRPPSDAPTCPRCGVYHADGPRACVSVDPYVAARALVEQREGVMARVMAGAREERDRAERERDVAHERIDAALDVLGDAGCSCECGHHHEEHDEDCERCLGCRIERALGDAA